MKFQNPILHFKFAKGNNLKRIKITFFLNFHKVIYSLSSMSCQSLKLLAVIVFEISSFSDLKKIRVTYFIYEILKRFFERKDTQKDGQTLSNMPFQLFQSWGIKN